MRYIIENVPTAVRFYTTDLRFTLQHDASPAFASVVRDGMRLLLSGDGSSGNIVTGPGEAQIILDDPSGNPVELFQPGPRNSR